MKCETSPQLPVGDVGLYSAEPFGLQINGRWKATCERRDGEMANRMYLTR